jgi:hypothetical protein
MKRTKSHRKPTFHKIKHKSNTKITFKKGLVKRTRDYLKYQDPNRKWEDDVLPRNMISSTEVSRINAGNLARTGIMNQQKEASQAIQQLNTEDKNLQRKYDKREKLTKQDDKVTEKIKSLNSQYKEQDKILKGQKKRKSKIRTSRK